MRIELTELVWLESHRNLTLAELSDLSGFSEHELRELEACGAIASLDPTDPNPHFGAECLVAARTAYRLRNDFELDPPGVALALAMLERIGALEAELRELRAQLPHRIR